ncbi:Endo-chitosanase B [Trichoderma ghanense]|uniref:Endo-chitosanase n=1 Tax=Trichoderma ghanense TaxID=65468 RepID=A0ABY2H101_9HYPO
MDVNCDGVNNFGGDCGKARTGPGQTASEDIVQSFGTEDLDANIYPYDVFANERARPSFVLW